MEHGNQFTKPTKNSAFNSLLYTSPNTDDDSFPLKTEIWARERMNGLYQE